MRTFTLHLESATQYERIEHVTSFVGRDASGSFGIWAGHARMITVLSFGLARFQVGERWEYLALPEAVLYCVNNEVTLTARRYHRDTHYERIAEQLEHTLKHEEADLHVLKAGVRRLQDELLRRLWRLGRILDAG